MRSVNSDVASSPGTTTFSAKQQTILSIHGTLGFRPKRESSMLCKGKLVKTEVLHQRTIAAASGSYCFGHRRNLCQRV